MLLVLPGRWSRSGFSWNGTETFLVVIVLLQFAGYIRFFAWPAPEPVLRARWAFYFPTSFALWFIAWRIEPFFEWVMLGYLGQLFGAVPPKYSIPGAIAVFGLYLPVKVGWARLGSLSLKEWFGYGAMAVIWSALGLFIHRLTVTSAERAKLIQELQAAREELKRAGERETELAALRERERLARELHDSLGHGLVTLTVQLEAAQRLYTVDPARASALMEEMKGLTRTSMEQLRRSLAGLRAPVLGARPLPEALAQLCSETSNRTGLRISCRVPAEAAQLSPSIAELLWRVAQEALANAERHAKATSVEVGVEVTADGGSPTTRQASLVVSDNGTSLPQDAERKPGHYGLRGLRERVEGVGGVFTAEAATPHGTRVVARVPVVT